jgi:hypothetical protein
MYNGMTGEQIETEIFIGPTYYMRLKHMTKDKINYRALGPNASLTRQPVSGRANDGGLRIGEMERDSMAGHGITNFLKESMMERADKYFMAVCNQTGMLAIYNPSKNIFMSPMADGPIKFTGFNDNLRLEKITKYGREFSIVAIPYSMKLFLHELQAMNIQMRIITEDNIQQLENLSLSSTNLGKILNDEHSSLEKLIEKIVNPKLAAAATAKEEVKGGKGEGEQEDLREMDKPLEPIKEEEGEEELTKKEDDKIDLDLDDSLENQDDKKKESKPQTQFKPIELMDDNFYSEKEEEGEKEGEEKDGTPFKMGETVYLRGDPKPNRFWKIKNIGNKFITIETDDLENIMTTDAIRVVSFLDIYSIVNAPTTLQSIGGQPTETQQPIMPPMGYAQPAINIKFVNGPDHSTTTEPMENIPVESFSQPEAYKFNKQETKTLSMDEMGNEGNGGEKSDDEKIDFSKKLIINKTG